MKTKEWATGVDGLDHALALELVQVTEAAALAAGRWVGHGDEISGKAAAVEAMHNVIGSVPMRGVVVLGEDGKRLIKGEEVGTGAGPACDVAINAGDGALSVARDVPNALAAVAVAERGALFDPPPDVAMEKLVVGPECAGVVELDRPVAENLRAVASAKGGRVSDVVVAVLNRPWHRELVHEIRDAGARVHLIEGGEIAGAIAVARPESPVDVLLGTGGAAEGVMAAAALSCLGGSVQARLRSDDSGTRHDVLHTEDLVRGERILFCATGVTGSEVLRGVQQHAGRTTTQSIVLCSQPETARIVKTQHRSA
ncbi:fructose-bisphosphatase class II family protein [Amycolatopsis sp. DSM 110486]|uniref:fructose-bisphosphatase class II family protein n=1 Tax=Amycolatopsis sp. DSM 110486 TaxID=2865832 RepID=UPI001C6961CD|nr:fructose-bisphosphatase class II family protein [Amycolatopsis sp. DSM 110486]QYN24458.1 fructose-bisphosphatase class II family protein [Amycolatopsis sp. DSM 110486]